MLRINKSLFFLPFQRRLRPSLPQRSGEDAKRSIKPPLSSRRPPRRRPTAFGLLLYGRIYSWTRHAAATLRRRRRLIICFLGTRSPSRKNAAALVPPVCAGLRSVTYETPKVRPCLLGDVGDIRLGYNVASLARDNLLFAGPLHGVSEARQLALES